VAAPAGRFPYPGSTRRCPFAPAGAPARFPDPLLPGQPPANEVGPAWFLDAQLVTQVSDRLFNFFAADLGAGFLDGPFGDVV